jgi:hypothetical protein
MAVGLLDGRTDRSTDMGKESAGAHVAREFAEVLVVPSRLDALEQAGLGLIVVPPDPESVAIGGLGAEF